MTPFDKLCELFVTPLILRTFEIIREWQEQPQVQQMLNEGCPNAD